MKKLAVLISGGGSNLQALIDNIHDKYGRIELVVSNKKSAYGLERAEKHHIQSHYIQPEGFNTCLLELLENHKIDFIVLAGYLKSIPHEVINRYRNKIINIHPSLIPSFCGKGYYGIKVHEKAIEYGVKISGATVHFVDEEMDTGPIIMQEAVCIDTNDTVEILQEKVLKVEHSLLCQGVKKMCQDKIILRGRRVEIL